MNHFRRIAQVLNDWNMVMPFKHLGSAMEPPVAIPALIIGLFLSLVTWMFWIAVVVMVWQFWAPSKTLLLVCIGVPMALLVIWAVVMGIRWVVRQVVDKVLWVFIFIVETITYRDPDGKAKWRWQK